MFESVKGFAPIANNLCQIRPKASIQTPTTWHGLTIPNCNLAKYSPIETY